MVMETSHIWLGSFPSKEKYLSYMKEVYSEDDSTPINSFASDQGVDFYDTDWEESFFNESTDLKSLVVMGSYSKDYLNEVIQDAKNKGVSLANTLILVDKNEIPKPKSIKNNCYSLTYIGAYKCDTSVPDFE